MKNSDGFDSSSNPLGIHNDWPLPPGAQGPRCEDETPESVTADPAEDLIPVRNPENDGVTDAEQRNQTHGSVDKDSEPENGEAQRPTGRLVQWAFHGQGFVGTTHTTQKLPTGTYKLDADQRVGWHLVPLPIVTDNLYRLPDTKSDDVIAEIQRFWELGDRFREFGFTHKRGILLWGPPGSGKTSTIALATQQMVQMGGLVIFADHPGGIVSVLYQVRSVEPTRPVIVILEDIDTIIKKHGESEVLSILDGEYSVDRIVFIATTNYPEQLDGRVVNRPSRFDKVVKIGTPNAEARRLYLVYKGVPESEVDKWVQLSEGFSIAHLKEMMVCVMCFGDALDDVAARLHAMARVPKSGNTDNAVGFGNRGGQNR